MRNFIVSTVLASSFLWGIHVAHGQYVAQTIQDRIDNDQKAITLDQNDMAAKQADIDSIVNDQQANAVTSTVAAVQTIEAATAQPVSAQPMTSTVNGVIQ